MHVSEHDSWPSTSNCGTCEYVCGDEKDMETHESDSHISLV